MSLFRNTYIIKLFSFIGLSIILLNLANKSVYTHIHLTKTGELVIHAHPFNQQDDNSPIKSHHHTALEFLTLSAFDIFTLTVFMFSALVVAQVILSKNYFFKTVVKQTHLFYSKNKSPPLEIAF
ncbi:hypothetical protein [Lutibacter oricola]|uniref:hypothetical protein n=1 Tax=Lutibacter oricola TaxID=762486 RepID=UPI000B7C599C|nr:hypothetical protein [Lutibacter oricola]